MKSEESMLAKVISEIFEPMVLFLGLILLAGWRAGIRGFSFGAYVLYILAVGGLVAISRIKLMRAYRTNWDLSNRPKRARILLMLLGLSILLFWSMYLWKNAFLISFYELLLLWMLGFVLLTLKIKLSGHMAVLVLTVGILTRWYDMSLWVLGSIIPLLAWSRIQLKRHSVLEVCVGTVYSLVVLVIYGKAGVGLH